MGQVLLILFLLVLLACFVVWLIRGMIQDYRRQMVLRRLTEFELNGNRNATIRRLQKSDVGKEGEKYGLEG